MVCCLDWAPASDQHLPAATCRLTSTRLVRMPTVVVVTGDVGTLLRHQCSGRRDDVCSVQALGSVATNAAEVQFRPQNLHPLHTVHIPRSVNAHHSIMKHDFGRCTYDVHMHMLGTKARCGVCSGLFASRRRGGVAQSIGYFSD